MIMCIDIAPYTTVLNQVLKEMMQKMTLNS